MGDWVNDNKGKGPWSFTPQPEKLGYVNNPRWVSTPASNVEHEPCGYWGKWETAVVGAKMLYGTGANDQESLGTGVPGGYVQFTPLQGDADWAFLAYGYGASLAIKTNGELWGAGSNAFGDLGNVGPSPVWKKLLSTTRWVQVACGGFHTLALDQSGGLWATGSNGGGQLGLGDFTNRAVFTPIGGGNLWQEIICGHNHTLALLQGGALYGCGSNIYNELPGFPATTNVLTSLGTSFVKVRGGFQTTVGIKVNGTLWGSGGNFGGSLGLGHANPQPSFAQEIGGFTDWVDASLGNSHCAAIRANGTLWTSGANSDGQLGLGDTTNRSVFTQVGSATDWASVRCAPFSTLALKKDGTLWVWGSNAAGEIGFESNADRLSPTEPTPGWRWASLGDARSYCTHSIPVFHTRSLGLRIPPGSSSPTQSPRPNPVWTSPT